MKLKLKLIDIQQVPEKKDSLAYCIKTFSPQFHMALFGCFRHHIDPPDCIGACGSADHYHRYMKTMVPTHAMVSNSPEIGMLDEEVKTASDSFDWIIHLPLTHKHISVVAAISKTNVVRSSTFVPSVLSGKNFKCKLGTKTLPRDRFQFALAFQQNHKYPSIRTSQSVHSISDHRYPQLQDSRRCFVLQLYCYTSVSGSKLLFKLKHFRKFWNKNH